jgi:phosphotransferase system  glucose/maltose/N-acetylglucosamine-specific IIC component
MSEHPLGVQILLVGVVPAVYGAITGYFLGISEPLYLVLSILGVLGGVAAGFDHVGAKAGALRGIAAGSIFGGFILIAHELQGDEAKADLPEPAILLVVITTVLAIAFAAIGGRARARAERKAVAHTAPDIPGPLG